MTKKFSLKKPPLLAAMMLLVLVSPRVLAAATSAEDLLQMLESNDRQREERLGGVHLAYTITVNRPPQPEYPKGSSETFHHELTRQGDSWRIDATDVHTKGPSGDRFDAKAVESHTGNRHQLYLEYAGENSPRAQEGQLWKPDAMSTKLSYLTFYNAFQGRPIASYLREIQSDITGVQVSEDGIQVSANVGGGAKARFTFDPASYDLVGMDVQNPDEGYHEQTTITHARTAAGITMPVAASKKMYVVENDKETLVRETLLNPIEPDQITTGREFSAAHFEFEFPPGTRVTDNIANLNYVAGAFSTESPAVKNLARTLAMVKKEDYEAVGKAYETAQKPSFPGAPPVAVQENAPSNRLMVVAGVCGLIMVFAAIVVGAGLKRLSQKPH